MIIRVLLICNCNRKMGNFQERTRAEKDPARSRNIPRLDLSPSLSTTTTCARARYGPYESIMRALGRINDTADRKEAGERENKMRVKRRIRDANVG